MISFMPQTTHKWPNGLAAQTIFIALQLGLNRGCCDYMRIKSPERLPAQARRNEKEVNER
jgi:hypothetical protein